jgi:uncharacterized glyoxalase superfamily protein PhnB/uncharacterized protein YndB with AHSA1/START domain
MKNSLLFNFEVDKANKQIKIQRNFQAPKDLVWAAWTEADLLDQWWAPKPYEAKTVSLDFKEGGRWFYYMLSPAGEKHYCLFDYESISQENYFTGLDSFCNEKGEANDTKPRVHWNNTFTSTGDATLVEILLSFKQLEDLEGIIAMGFKEGFTMGLENLDQYIAAQFYLRKQKKPNQQARVSTYLNFDGKTEEAFLFYQSIFKTEFIGGIQKFGEIPASPDQPAIADEIKNMVLHVELPLLGGHILMGTDAPKEMGFTLNSGNNMHINLEPDSRAEADRLFDALAKDGIIDMPMQDMFFGAYYGALKDKYGINWMITFQNK